MFGDEFNINYPYWSADYKSGLKNLKLKLVFEASFFSNFNDISVRMAIT